MPSDILHSAITAYGLDVSQYMPMQSGYRNKNYPLKLSNGRIVNLIIYKRELGMEQTIKNAHRLGTYLSSCQFSARAPYDSRILRLFAGQPEQFAGLYEYLPGTTIPWEGYTMNHLKSLGASLSCMHALLHNQPQLTLPAATEVYVALIARMEHYFSDGVRLKSITTKLSIRIDPTFFPAFYRLHRAVSHLPNQQPIHLDFVRSNVLFIPNSSDVSGVLDFEKAAYGSPAIDIARTLAFLLVDCKHKSDAQIRKYFLYSGYNKRGKAHFKPILINVGQTKLDVLETLVDFFLFYDFYKFLLHNPYESLRENQHFTRTKNLLISRGILNKQSA